MLLTLKAKLSPDREQKEKLVATMERFNEACNKISRLAFEQKCYNKIVLQQQCYYEIRDEFKLPAQLAIRAIAKAVESSKPKRKPCMSLTNTGLSSTTSAFYHTKDWTKTV